MMVARELYRSVKRPHLTLEHDDVFECDDCNGYGETYQRSKWGDTYATPCATCNGYGLLHGWSGPEALPAAVEHGLTDKRDVRHPAPLPLRDSSVGSGAPDVPTDTPATAEGERHPAPQPLEETSWTERAPRWLIAFLVGVWALALINVLGQMIR